MKTLGILFVAAIAACGDRVELKSEDASSRLSYRCSNPSRRVQSKTQISLLKGYAAKIASIENSKGNKDLVTRLMRAYSSPDVGQLESIVVRYLCDHGSATLAASQKNPTFPDSGTVAPRFKLPRLSYDYVVADSATVPHPNRRVVLLTFWATWCIPCVREHPLVTQIHEDFSAQGLEVYAVLHKDPIGNARRWLVENGGMTYPLLIDPDNRIAKAYGIDGIPRMFLIDGAGRLISSCIGCATGKLSPDSIRITIADALRVHAVARRS
jgi:peroxiredoxin